MANKRQFATSEVYGNKNKKPRNDIEQLKILHSAIQKQLQENKFKKISSDELWKLFCLYEDWKTLSDLQQERPQEEDISHRYLYFLSERLYWSNCSDSELVVAVIVKIFKEIRHFSGIIFLTDLYNASVNGNGMTSQYHALDFFFHHVYKKKILFNGERMACRSLFLRLAIPDDLNWEILYQILPEIYLSCLKYGSLLHPVSGRRPNSHANALKTYINIDDITYGSLPPFVETLDYEFFDVWNFCINKIFTLNPELLPFHLLSISDEELQLLKHIVCVVNLLMREAPQLTLGGLFGFPNIELGSQEMVDVIRKLGQFVPELPSRCLDPMSLKHNCRQTVRTLLHLNWQLPHSIFKMDIPKELMSYLNLETD